VDAAWATLARLFVNAFFNAGFGQVKLMTPNDKVCRLDVGFGTCSAPMQGSQVVHFCFSPRVDRSKGTPSCCDSIERKWSQSC